jgi:hypothetical protein
MIQKKKNKKKLTIKEEGYVEKEEELAFIMEEFRY